MSKQTRNILTKLHLDKDYVHIVNRTDYKLKAPDGFETLYKMTIPNNVKDLYAHAGITIESVDNEGAKRSIVVGGVKMDIIDPNTLQFVSDSKPMAAELYKTKIKPELRERGYKVLEHECFAVPVIQPLKLNCLDENLKQYSV